MTIRPATGDDVAGVLALEVELFGADAWSEQTVLATLDRGRVLVAEDGGVLLGYVVLADADDVADLERIGVRRDHQRAGLASALLDAALRDARAGTGCCSRCAPTTGRPWPSTHGPGSRRSTGAAATTATAPMRIVLELDLRQGSTSGSAA